MKETIKWGIVGPGKIAHKFAADLLLVHGAELTAVASRNLERAQAFAQTYGATDAYGSYEELFSEAQVDVVYIATPHTSHAQLSRAALQNGKAVLCEKPMGMNRSEVASVIEVAQASGKFFMEALWSRFNPNLKKVYALVAEGKLGKVSYLNADFAFYGLDFGATSRVLDPQLGGGSLLDIGIYPIFLSYMLFGKPDRLAAHSRMDERGTEIQTSMLFSGTDWHAVLYSGLNTKSRMEAEIQGDKGSIYIDGRWHEARGFTLENGETSEKIVLEVQGNGYCDEIREVNQCLRHGQTQSALWSHQNSLDLSELLDRVRAAAGIRFPFEG
ncbi:Gfo/Idh/MocA family protein [Sediminicola luteus]|uniref:Oxidoreductase n=1 Tax=Sediminicola luteus TaxID=319238 RepID=A0A2A4G8S5_9FLAO|nr:Gfo/Idh/MocA family oxidoreductase [Sediminicola luteus]PCE64172.1 oxidoreductase [Sediminicola luteus]